MMFLLFNLGSHISEAVMGLKFLHMDHHLTLGTRHFQFGAVYCKMFAGLFPLEYLITSLHWAFNVYVFAEILEMSYQFLITH